jgi:hypothetical protein
MKTSDFKNARVSGYVPKSITVLIGEKNANHIALENRKGYLDERYKGEIYFVVIENKTFDVRFLHGISIHLMQTGERNDDLINWVMDELDKFSIPIFSITVKNDEKPYYPDVLISSVETSNPEIVKELKTNLAAQWRAFQ